VPPAEAISEPTKPMLVNPTPAVCRASATSLLQVLLGLVFSIYFFVHSSFFF
jgi:hypothetical protein